MKAIISASLLCFISCIGGTSNFSETLSSGYIYSNQGEGANSIYGTSGKIKSIDWIKKYSDDGQYISIWQGDSTLFQSHDSNYGKYKKNSYNLEDLFYIIDIKNEKLFSQNHPIKSHKDQKHGK